MSGTIITGTYSSTVVLNSPDTQNPVTIAPTGQIDTYGQNGINGAGFAWTITNQGNVAATARSQASASAIDLSAGGFITNFGNIDGGTSGAHRFSNGTGITIDGAAGSVVNYGTIAAYVEAQEHNTGVGILLAAGGTVINGDSTHTAALIEATQQSGFGHTAANLSATGIDIAGGVGTVINYGTILASGQRSVAVYLSEGGTVINGHLGDSTASLGVGALHGAILGNVDTLVNYGTIGEIVGDIGRLVVGQGAVFKDGLPASVGAIEFLAGSDAFTVASPSTTVIFDPGVLINDSVDISQTITSSTVLSGGNEIVLAGGKAVDTLVESGGILTVSSGGVATGATVSSGGTVANFGTLGAVSGQVDRLVVGAGATFTGVVQGDAGSVLEFTSGSDAGARGQFSGFSTVVFDPGVFIGSGETLTVSGGISRSVVSSGGTEIVVAGGRAVNTLVEAGGTLRVSSGGVATTATISGGGSVTVGGREIITSGGAATGSLLSDGGAAVVSSGGVARATEVLSGGALHVSNGGIASNGTVFAGGELSVFGGGIARSTQVFSGGELLVSRGGVANHATIVGNGPGVGIGGRLLVSSGGVVSVATVSSAGAVVVSSSGVAKAVTVGDDGLLHVSNGGTASGTKVLAGGTAAALTGGTMLATSIGAGGLLDVFHGSASATQVSNGGQMAVSGGGTATLTRVLGGVLTVLASGTTVDTRLSGGEEIVSSGAHAIGTLVSNGGMQVVSSGGMASGTDVQSGGELLISKGGIATDLTVFSGGTAEIGANGLATDPTINGGTLVLDSLYTLTGPIDFGSHNSGSLVISSALLPGSGNVISGFVPSDTVDLATTFFSTSGSVALTAGNVLVVTENGHNYKLYLDPAQNFAGDTFHIKDDGHGDTLVYETAGAAPLALGGRTPGASPAYSVGQPTSAGLLGGTGASSFSLTISTGFG